MKTRRRTKRSGFAALRGGRNGGGRGGRVSRGGS